MSSAPLLKQIQSLSPASRRWNRLAILLGGAGGICIIVQAGLLAHIIHAAFIEDTPRETLFPLFLLLAGVIGMRGLLAWGREISGQKISTLIRRHIRAELLEHLHALGPLYAKNKQTAPLTNTLLERTEALHGYFAHYLPQKSLAMLIPITIGLSALWVSWVVGLIFLITAPLIPLFMVMIGRGAEKLNQKNFTLLSRMSAHFLDTLQGLATLKIFQRAADQAEEVEKSSEQYRKGTMTVLRVAFLSSAVLEFLTSVAIAMTAVFLGLSYLQFLDFGLYQRELTLQTGLFLLLLAPEFYQPLRDLGTHYHARAEALGAAQEINAILTEPVPETTPATADSLTQQKAINLELTHVSHSFDKGRRSALTDLNLQVKAGEWLAIVGASGAGKSTLLNLLLGFLPLQQGAITVNGHPLNRFNPDDWQRHIAWVPQQPALFDGSLGENIALGDPSISREKLRAAARAAQADKITATAEQSLDLAVGEQGNQLSGGEARRVALARVFAKDAPLILLDEPTAGLDRENEQMIMTSLKQLAPGKTLIMLTHRLDTARIADRIAVMAAGAVVEQGNHEELINLNGVYAGLVNSGRQVLS
ncbi:MAG: thiol reductant ABC exporter subunit CydD [Pelovirga sp.]